MDNLLNRNNHKNAVKEYNLDLYTALSIFTANAPKLIDTIIDTIETESLTELEDLAAKLIRHSNNAQLTGFTERVKTLIIAARERNIPMVEKQADSLKQCFEQMTRTVRATA
ncbi:MAG: hypothetical protein WC496_06570 [Phycisphaerae bacterium]|jgi:formate-dependent phosphoribosylglycinamide formyltransferase (GAR transformylase)